MHADEWEIGPPLVRRLPAGQFPRWAELPIEPVESSGTVNALYRLGGDATWARGRGWALAMALIQLPCYCPARAPGPRCGSWAAARARAPRRWARGLPFAANYHVGPATVVEAVTACREESRPSRGLSAPHVLVSADAVAGPGDATARTLAAGYPAWVRSIRPARARSRSPRPRRLPRSGGPRRTGRWWRTGWTPSSRFPADRGGTAAHPPGGQRR